MKNIMSMKQMCKRVKELVPETRFVARYEATDKELSTILKQYRNTSFLYLLVSNWENEKCIIYVGKSINQYNRMLNHKKKYEYDEIYLFYVPMRIQSQAESRLIEELHPLYNKACNEKRKELEKIGIRQEGYKSQEKILEDIRVLVSSQKMQHMIFYLPCKYAMALRRESEKRKETTNEILEKILDEFLPEESWREEIKMGMGQSDRIPELLTTKEYAKLHHKSVEQIKVHCRNNRIAGAYKFERDWLIPCGAPYPEDARRR